MRRKFRWAVPGSLLALLSLTAVGSAGQSRTQGEAQAPPPGTIACRVLEAHAVENLGVTLVVFHHRDEAARGAMSELLRQHSGATVEFQTRDGQWHPATLLRLKSCFGRGLLVFSTGSARLAEKEEFALRVREAG